MKWLTVCFVAAAGTSANAICLNPLGCEPRNYDQCRDDASRRGTDAGVRIAMQACHDKFIKPQEERAEKERQQRAARLAEEWPKIGEKYTATPAILKMAGEEPAKFGPTECATVNGGKPPPGTKCFLYSWADRRSTACETNALGCRFELQVLNDKDRTLWAWWPEPR